MNPTYPVRITSHENVFLAEVPDIPGTQTHGESEQEVLEWIEDALTVMLSMYMESHLDIPQASKPRKGQATVTVSPVVAAKIALYQAMKDQKISETELCRRLNSDERHVRRLLNLDHPTRLDHLVSALAALGKRLEIIIRDAA